MLLLIDGNALLHRCFHALPQTIRTSAGELTNAIFGFTNATIELMDKLKPSHIVCTFDSPGDTFRHTSYPEYKATRQEAAPGLYEQLPRLLTVLEALGVVNLALPGYESDDIIGTLTAMAEEKQLNSEIVSSDNDFVQLISPLTSFLCTAKGLKHAELFTPEKVLEKHGLHPSQWIDYKALRGDPSDNLPGVPGIGEKTAKQLLQEWHSLENLYQHLEQLKSGVHEKLKQSHEVAMLTKQLVTIDRHSPILVTIDDILYQGPNNKEMARICSELEFHRLTKRFTVPETLF